MDKTRNQRQANRRNSLNNHATRAGWASWSEYETSVINGNSTVEPAMKKYYVYYRLQPGTELKLDWMMAHNIQEVEKAFSDHVDVEILTENEYIAKYR